MLYMVTSPTLTTNNLEMHVILREKLVSEKCNILSARYTFECYIIYYNFNIGLLYSFTPFECYIFKEKNDK